MSGTTGFATTPGATSSGLAGIAPTSQTQNPQAQNIMQQLAQMPVEQLQQIASSNGNSQLGQLAQRYLQQRRQNTTNTGPAAGGATTTAMPTMARGGGLPGYADGGPPSTPSWVRQAERTALQKPVGLLMHPGGGRTDDIKAAPESGSYVLPADVVSGLGEGNTLAGARVLTKIMGMGPHGIPMPPDQAARSRFAGLPAPPPLPPRDSRGGPRDGATALLAGGEYIVDPATVRQLGAGDLDRGHKILDDFVLRARKKTIKTMGKLPGPVK